MLRLCGFPVSNYYNKVKFVLLEHDIPFEASIVSVPIKDPAFLADTPLGKVPYLMTEHGSLCESQAIIEYLAAIHPDKPISRPIRSRRRRRARSRRCSSCTSNGTCANCFRRRSSAAR